MNHKKPLTFRLVPPITVTEEEKEHATQVKREIINLLLLKVMDKEKPSQ